MRRLALCLALATVLAAPFVAFAGDTTPASTNNTVPGPVIPEPSAALVFAVGGLIVAGALRRRS